MYRRPELYDAIYSFKDYEQEAVQLHELIQKYKKSSGNKLLDIACGTGRHIESLGQWYECSGLDKSRHLLVAARQRNPGVEFFETDMMYFDLGAWYDAVVCLFSAIGYVGTFGRLESTIARFAMHAAPGGVVAVEPWIFPENFTDGRMALDTVDTEGFKVARMSRAERSGDMSILHFHFMVGCATGIEYWSDSDEVGLFRRMEYQVAMERAGLETHFEEGGFSGRGMFIGVKPL